MACPECMGGICAHIKVLDLFGFPVCAGKPQEILELVWERMQSGRITHIVTLNPEIIMQSQDEPENASILNAADLFVADGQGVCWALSKLNRGSVDRYPGIDLARDLMARLSENGGSVFLLGSEPGVAEEACRALSEDLPGLKVVGHADGFFEWELADRVVDMVRAGKPDLLLVGMGFPRQDRFIVQFRDELEVPVLIGVGGALEVFAGRQRRAPLWMRRWGLEWVYRTLVNITRLGRLKVIPRFIAKTFRESSRRVE